MNSFFKNVSSLFGFHSNSPQETENKGEGANMCSIQINKPIILSETNGDSVVRSMNIAEKVSYIEPKCSTQEEVYNYLTGSPSGITFVHGKAGCGKTYLINRITQKVQGCQVLVPTNLAASLYKGARTMHSFFYGAFDNLDEGYQNPENIVHQMFFILIPQFV
jgi:ATP-dependent DNA helicase PIF1